jgi:pimeloyl-ACP methyl ester carboxylesterase
VGPWPESLLAFEQVWGPLAEHAHLIAVDLPGYEHSGGRADQFEPRTMGDFMVRLADGFELECLHTSEDPRGLPDRPPRRPLINSLGLVRAYPQELPVLADLLPHINTPVQIIHGDHDAAFLPINANFLHERLPHSKLDFRDGNESRHER